MNLPLATVRQTTGEFTTPGMLLTIAFQIGSLPLDVEPNSPPPLRPNCLAAEVLAAEVFVKADYLW